MKLIERKLSVILNFMKECSARLARLTANTFLALSNWSLLAARLARLIANTFLAFSNWSILEMCRSTPVMNIYTSHYSRQRFCLHMKEARFYRQKILAWTGNQIVRTPTWSS